MAGKTIGVVRINHNGKKLGTFKVKNGKADIRLRRLEDGKHRAKALFKDSPENWKKSSRARKFRAR